MCHQQHDQQEAAIAKVFHQLKSDIKVLLLDDSRDIILKKLKGKGPKSKSSLNPEATAVVIAPVAPPLPPLKWVSIDTKDMGITTLL